MKTTDLLITVASWEPRFILGIERTLEQWLPSHVVAYYLQEYEGSTEEARSRLRKLLRDRQVSFQEHTIEFGSPEHTWRLLEQHLGPKSESPYRHVLIDLTTMPREVIWGALFWLEAADTGVSYVYNLPKSYGDDWLTRNPDEPRFMFKLAGELKLGAPTCLVAVTGFDLDRCLQAIEFYEPSRILIAKQKGNQFGNLSRNSGDSFGSLGTPYELTEVDAYSSDHGYGDLQPSISELVTEYNVVLCSFGPKLSAIALYQLQRSNPQTALAYIGSKEYSPEYSSGLGGSVDGTFRIGSYDK